MSLGYLNFDPVDNFILPRYDYYRYDSRTGRMLMYCVQEGLMAYKNLKYFTKAGEPRKSINLPGGRVWLLKSHPNVSQSCQRAFKSIVLT